MGLKNLLVVFKDEITIPEESVSCYTLHPQQTEPIPEPAWYETILSCAGSGYRMFDAGEQSDLGRLYDGISYRVSRTTTGGNLPVYRDGAWVDPKYKVIVFTKDPETIYPDQETFMTWIEENAAAMVDLDKLLTLDGAKVLYNDLRDRIEALLKLPAVTAEDDGKVLTVINGVWTAAPVANTDETQDIIDEYQGGN